MTEQGTLAITIQRCRSPGLYVPKHHGGKNYRFVNQATVRTRPIVGRTLNRLDGNLAIVRSRDPSQPHDDWLAPSTAGPHARFTV